MIFMQSQEHSLTDNTIDQLMAVILTMSHETPNLECETSSIRSKMSASSELYSHVLYQKQSPKNTILVTSCDIEESRWSSCSTSPTSSCESLEQFPLPPSSRLSATPSALSAALSAYSGTQGSRPSSYSSSRYADDHYPLIMKVKTPDGAVQSTILDIAHCFNAYIRAINSCYNHALGVTDGDLTDFLFFNQTLYNILSQHFELDRQHLRPLLHRPTASPYLAAQDAELYNDATFQSAFTIFGQYIHDKDAPAVLERQHYQALISTFAPRLVQHLHNQVEQLNALVSDNILMPEHLCKIWCNFAESLSSKLDLHTDAALLLGCQDRDFRINGKRAEYNFPRLPMGTATMVKKWHSRRHEGAWIFCSSNFSGRRRVISP